MGLIHDFTSKQYDDYIHEIHVPTNELLVMFKGILLSQEFITNRYRTWGIKLNDLLDWFKYHMDIII